LTTPDTQHPTPITQHPRFLVIKLADLGDALTATPAIRALRTTFPSATIDALVTPVGAAVLAGLDSVDHLIPFEKALFDRLQPAVRPLAQAFALGMRLRKARYDRVFLFHHLFTPAGRLKYAALLGAIGSPWRAGLAEDCPAFLTHVLRDDGYGVRHEADYWLGVVGLAGAVNPSPRFEVEIDDQARTRAARLLGGPVSDDGRPLVAICPGAGAYSPARRWPPDRYARVGQRLVEDVDAEILVVGSSAERDLAADVCDGIGHACRNLAGLTDVKTLAAIFNRCNLFIGNDGGAMNLAVASGVAVVAVFGPSNHVSWGPYGGTLWQPGFTARSAVVRADVPCAPCLYRGYVPGTRFGCRARDCLRLVDVETVVEAAQHFLNLNPGKNAEL
jgi:ADP-heptose:LPS heptosyltransferase